MTRLLSFWIEPQRHPPTSVRNRLPRGNKLRKLIVWKNSDVEFSKLRISRAYIKLFVFRKAPQKSFHCPHRKLRSSHDGEPGRRLDAAPLFSIELFDHDGQSLLDSCICYSLDEGAAAFQDFISR